MFLAPSSSQRCSLCCPPAAVPYGCVPTIRLGSPGLSIFKHCSCLSLPGYGRFLVGCGSVTAVCRQDSELYFLSG